MLSENIKVGDRLEIVLKRDEARGKPYVSQVENILDKDHLMVLVPISYGQIVRIPVGDMYSCLFITDKGMIRFDTAIQEIIKEDGFNLMKIKLLSEGEKMQRREFFRFTCLLPLKYTVINDAGGQETPQAMHEGIIKDVGGGGIRFVSNEHIEEGAKIKCLILLNEDYFIIIGMVLHRQSFPKSVYKYQYRAAFIDILPNEQERIVQFIFSEQRKNLARTSI